MRRRTNRQPAEVPAELLEFRLADWSQAPLVPAGTDVGRYAGGDARREWSISSSSCSEATKGAQRAVHRWVEARWVWSQQHGWPYGDVFERMRDELAARRAVRRQFGEDGS